MTQTTDPITVQVIRAALDGIVQEMQTSLFRTGFSTIIRESHDASCAILNTKAEVIAQHVVLPLHMGAFPACTEGLLERFPPEELHGRATPTSSITPTAAAVPTPRTWAC